MGQTLSEKILSHHAGRSVAAGELVVVNVDGSMASDTTAPLTIKAFEEMGGKQVHDPSRTCLVIDHAAPAPNERIGNLHELMRQFARDQGTVLYDVGAGICHQLMVDNVHVRPGELFIGADSHTCSYGALGAFATGVGSTDLAAVWRTGKTWLKVPQTIRVEVDGTLRPGVQAKDLTLFLVGELGISGATYQAIEFCGSGVEQLDLGGRFTLANMAIEMGAKVGLVHPEGLSLPYEFTPLRPDDDARYVRHLSYDVDDLAPQLSAPGSPDDVHGLERYAGTPITYAFIGSCVNGRLEDLHTAARVLRDAHIAPGVRLVIAPASRDIFLRALGDGTVAELTRAGATFLPSGCGPCVGTHAGVPGDGETVISTANRNFTGRMGNPRAHVFLGAPSSVAAAALTGRITDPTPFLED
ncbi:MAG TPA: 3-isopropylmalate dehydratase large subunit [Deltaproteobacteria bacterium]|nr:3-isopropylmalate dehydratase large subunit [Deltaproteobacteria bacterium]HCP46691.1 3-isopropylmalate dehydratase large subunit [Deltaproteobacteria bacterium]